LREQEKELRKLVFPAAIGGYTSFIISAIWESWRQDLISAI
jgi:hypothetical protein